MINTQNQYTRLRRSAAVMAAIVLLFAPRLVEAQSYTIAPIPFLYVWNTSGAIVPNGCVWTYAAGTTTPIATYADNAGTPNGNPIVSDNFGRFVAYLLPGTNYKFAYETTPCNSGLHGATLKTQDNVQGVPASAANVDIVGTAGEAIAAAQCVYLSDGSGGKTQGQYYKCDSTNGYSSTLPVIGFAPSAISSATTGTIRLAGSLTGLSSLTVGAPYFASSSSGSITATAPANRRFVGSADSTTSIVVAGNPALMTAAASGTASSATYLRGDQTWSTLWTPVTTTATGTQSGAWVTLTGSTLIRANNATLLSVAGLPAGYDGQLVRIVSVGAGQVDTLHQSGSEATAAARLINWATSGNTSAAAGVGMFDYQYDGTTARWRLVAHEQGAWITPAYVAGNYTATTGSWTVDAGDVAIERYMLRGRVVTYAFNYGTTSTSNATAGLSRVVPGGFTVANQINQANVGADIDNGGTRELLVIVPVGNSTTITFNRGTAVNWSISANLTSLFATIVFEVQ